MPVDSLRSPLNVPSNRKQEGGRSGQFCQGGMPMYSQSNVTELPTSGLGEKNLTRFSKLNSESKNVAEAGSILIIFKVLARHFRCILYQNLELDLLEIFELIQGRKLRSWWHKEDGTMMPGASLE